MRHLSTPILLWSLIFKKKTIIFWVLYFFFSDLKHISIRLLFIHTIYCHYIQLLHLYCDVEDESQPRSYRWRPRRWHTPLITTGPCSSHVVYDTTLHPNINSSCLYSRITLLKTFFAVFLFFKDITRFYYRHDTTLIVLRIKTCPKERTALNFSHVSVKTCLNLVFGMVAPVIITSH